MAFEYVDDLPVSEDVREKVRALGARTPLALMSMIEYARPRFESMFGSEVLDVLMSSLPTLIPAAEREKHATLPDFKPSFGALKSPPPSQDTVSARMKRDQIAERIHELRASEQTEEVQQSIKELENLLREELKKTAYQSASVRA